MKSLQGTPPSEKSLAKSILRALQVLDQFALRDEMGIKDLSLGTGIPQSSVQRIVNTMEMKNYLVQDPKSHKYRLGTAFLAISGKYAQNLHWVDSARESMEQFAKTHGETVNLAILQGFSLVYLTKVDSPHILRPNFTVGTRYPAYCTALGRCMLAYQEGLDIEACLRDAGKMTGNTVIDAPGMRELLKKIRENGYAVEDEEFQYGLFCIAAPVRDINGRVVAAISTSIPKTRIEKEKLPLLIEDIKKTADDASRRLRAARA